MSKKLKKYLAVIGSVASILGIIFFFLPEENQNKQITSGNKSPNVITNGDNTNVKIQY